ncbi:LolA family protein [Halobacillus amylolyticus]|uniref:Outer membrane lipoprotein carrier protein LolA n=1 Tax=Halobacillus amylolyticus TaxID=2932259 RepID=A0ABY4H6L7_9BACI|nr:outer membrane lipoprotein carrier protein LolA [Halobacillus amylolyticus]UOR10322.1 outer membrane lipoprotein carrier protein LolA [Halobacillus amylolyticus]
MKKRFPILLFVLVTMMIVISACGEKSKEDVVKKLSQQAEEMAGYKTDVTMTMRTGKEEQKYQIQIWHKKEDFYKVKLHNEEDEKGNQIILKNKNGVYVLTPALNKSFKFQSDWPENTSQPYLYASLVEDIKKDTEGEFTTTENHYVFKTKTNYQNNKTLPSQEIYFDKKTFKPVMVKVFDQDMQALVEVQFNDFNKADGLKKEDFDVDQNMAMAPTEAPVSNMEEGNQANAILYPQETLGAELVDKQEVQTDEGTRVIMTYQGEKSFTLIQEPAEVEPTSAGQAVPVSGDPVQLTGGTVGAMSGQRLRWSQSGTTFNLASEELTQEEMVSVASSINSHSSK